MKDICLHIHIEIDAVELTVSKELPNKNNDEKEKKKIGKAWEKNQSSFWPKNKKRDDEK